MKPSQSHILDIRGLRYHVRTWGSASHPPLILLHGWMDVSASFQFLVDALAGEWYAVAPDWRGFGLTEWTRDGYWFPDYLADLDALLDRFAPQGQVNLVGHSMGGNIAGLYSGVRPQRVRRLALLEGWGLARTGPEIAPRRYEKWLDQLKEAPGFRPYASFDEVAERLKKNNPRLSDAKARFLAPHWAKRNESGEIVLLSDPRHKLINPVLYRLDEAMACWRRITAPTLWVEGDGEWAKRWVREQAGELAQRKACFGNLTERSLPHAGHMMHHDQPEQLAAILEQFLAA